MYPYWMDLAIGEFGIKEIPGPEHNKDVLKYHESTYGDNSTDEIPWCSSFVNWCIKESGRKGTNSKWARGWLRWGWKVFTPMYGAIVVLSRGNNPTQGHVGFLIAENSKHIILLGGNQNNSVCYMGFDKNRVLGMRWPHA